LIASLKAKNSQEFSKKPDALCLSIFFTWWISFLDSPGSQNENILLAGYGVIFD